MYGPFKNGDCDTNLVMFLRTRTTARINVYMIYANSTSTLQPEQTDVLVFELYFCVELRKRQTGMVPCTVCNTWSPKSHSRLHVLAVEPNIHL